MKKYITILLFLLPVLAFGQLIKSDQINTDPFKPDSLYVANPLTYVAPSTDTITFVGTSITAGTGATTSALGYASQLARLLHLRINNQGVSGSTLGNPSVSGTSLINNLSRIPTKRTHQKWLVLEYAPNDICIGFSYSSITFNTDYNTVMSNAIGKGWSGSNVIILTTVYINNASKRQTMTAPQFQARQDSFNNVIKAEAVANSTFIVDVNKIMIANGSDFLSWDGLHPNNRGHLLIAQSIMDVISPNVLKKGQPEAVNGLSEVRNSKLHNYGINGDTTNYLLERDTVGNVVTSNTIPPQTKTGSTLFINGQLIRFGATTPSTGLGTNDWLLAENDIIWGVFNGSSTFTSQFKPIDAFGSMNFTTTYSLGKINFNVNTSVVGLSIIPPGYFSVAGANSLTPIAGDIWTPQGNAGFKSTVSSVTGAFMPLLSDDFTALWNSYNAGGFHFYTANGTNGGKIEMMRETQNGQLIFNPGTTITPNPIAIQQFDYNTGVILPPRVTTAGRDSMAYVLPNASGITGGSGYTVAPTLAISAPGGSGVTATATCTVSGGAINSFTVTNKGSGYYTVPTITITPVSGGSGGAITALISMTKSKGSIIYNSTNGRIESYNGTNWLGSPGNSTTSDNVHYIAGDGSYNLIGSKPHTIFTPTTGGTVALTNNQYNIINPSGALLALTVNLPSSPANNDCVYIKFTQNVTTVTYGNGTVVDGITAPTAGGLTVLVFDQSSSSWY